MKQMKRRKRFKTGDTVLILKKDFDLAVKQPWSAKTCLLAQAGKRLRLNCFYALGTGIGATAMNKFDKAYHRRNSPTKPVDWKALNRLRASLPIKVIVS